MVTIADDNAARRSFSLLQPGSDFARRQRVDL
jgi:hypothetical protein